MGASPPPARLNVGALRGLMVLMVSPPQAGGPGPGAVQRVRALLQHLHSRLLPPRLHPAAALLPPALHAAHRPGVHPPACHLPPALGSQVRLPLPLRLCGLWSWPVGGRGRGQGRLWSVPTLNHHREGPRLGGERRLVGFGWENPGWGKGLGHHLPMPRSLRLGVFSLIQGRLCSGMSAGQHALT